MEINNLLPDVGEWAVLAKDTPLETRALRRYLTELIGVLDPLFSVSIENRTRSPIEVSSLTYTATHVETYMPATFGLLALADVGFHSEWLFQRLLKSLYRMKFLPNFIQWSTFSGC